MHVLRCLYLCLWLCLFLRVFYDCAYDCACACAYVCTKRISCIHVFTVISSLFSVSQHLCSVWFRQWSYYSTSYAVHSFYDMISHHIASYLILSYLICFYLSAFNEIFLPSFDPHTFLYLLCSLVLFVFLFFFPRRAWGMFEGSSESHSKVRHNIIQQP